MTTGTESEQDRAKRHRQRTQSFDLVISSAAFHWIDPEVAFGKSARLLRPGGWLALLGTEERYDHPLGPALDALWIRYAYTA